MGFVSLDVDGLRYLVWQERGVGESRGFPLLHSTLGPAINNVSVPANNKGGVGINVVGKNMLGRDYRRTLKTQHDQYYPSLKCLVSYLVEYLPPTDRLEQAFWECDIDNDH